MGVCRIIPLYSTIIIIVDLITKLLQVIDGETLRSWLWSWYQDCRLCVGHCIVYRKSQLFVILRSLICLSLQNSNQDFDCSKCPSSLSIGPTASTMEPMNLYQHDNYLYWLKMYIRKNIRIFIPKNHFRRIY